MHLPNANVLIKLKKKYLPKKKKIKKKSMGFNIKTVKKIC